MLNMPLNLGRPTLVLQSQLQLPIILWNGEECKGIPCLKTISSPTSQKQTGRECHYTPPSSPFTNILPSQSTLLRHRCQYPVHSGGSAQHRCRAPSESTLSTQLCDLWARLSCSRALGHWVGAAEIGSRSCQSNLEELVHQRASESPSHRCTAGRSPL